MSINRDQNVVEYLCGKIGSILREDSFDYVEHYGEMSNAALQTLMVGRGRELYVKLQAMIGEHLQKMHQQVFISSFTTENKSVDGIDDRILQSLCRQWFEFSEKMIIVRQVLLSSERVFDNSVGEESLIVFAWRIYRSILEQDSEHLPKLLNIVDVRTPNRKKSNILARSKVNQSVRRRSLFSDDTLFDFFRFVDTASLGLSVALCCRRFANFADSVLRGRTHSDCALMLCDGQNDLFPPPKKSENPIGAFAIRLWNSNGAKVNGRGFGRHIYHHGMLIYQVIDQWFSNPREQQPLDLSEIEIPEWITGMSFLYMPIGVTPSVLSFLQLISPMLQNCCLKFELASLWPKLHTSGQLLPFLSLFNPLTFSLQLTFDELSFFRVNNHFYKLPLWATFQSIFFPNCFDLSLPLSLLSSREIGIDVATWLHNERSTVGRPRRVVFSDQPKEINSMGQSFMPGVNAMIGLIKQKFAEGSGKRHFVVESSSKLLNEWDERLLQNGNSECLLVSPKRIVRCSIGDEHTEFEQFHDHLRNGKGTKVGPTVQIGTSSSVRWLKEVMAQMPSQTKRD
uniref:F-box domain-containing protein n=1 Tax=Globodera rostochiensis TaxID=31243 RepID=A0A914HYD8_GLORO